MNPDADDPDGLVTAWLSAARRGDVRTAVTALHDQIAGEVARVGPTCAQSGRCCRFEEFGHRLYVTGLEASVTLLGAGLIGSPAARHNESTALESRAPSIENPVRLPVLDQRCERPRGVALHDGDESTALESRATPNQGPCPLLVGRECGVHEHRPAGCRVFYCDDLWAPAMSAVSERASAQVRAIHQRFDIPYRYMEWRALLGWFGLRHGVWRRTAEHDDQ